MRSGVESGEQLREPGVLVADECVGGQPHVVEEQLELLFRVDQFHLDHGAGESGCVGGHHEQRRQSLPVLASAVRATMSTESAWSTPEMKTFCPFRIQSGTIAVRGGGDTVRVGSGIRLGDAEGHHVGAVGQSRHPALLLFVGAEADDDVAADGR